MADDARGLRIALGPEADRKLYPGGAIASDAMPWTLSDGKPYTGDAWPLPEDATSHPRSARARTISTTFG